jgi:hypothetical protein
MTDITSPSSLDMEIAEGNRIQMDRERAINFICLSSAAISIGMLADRIGLRQAFLWTALSGLVAAPLVFILPRAPG